MSVCVTSVFALQRKKLGCVKTLQNLPFQLAKFCILDAKFEIIFCKKPRGQVMGAKFNSHKKKVSSGH